LFRFIRPIIKFHKVPERLRKSFFYQLLCSTVKPESEHNN